MSLTPRAAPQSPAWRCCAAIGSWKTRGRSSCCTKRSGNCCYARQSFRTLTEQQQASRLDLSSREGHCGALPEEIDVRQLHANSLSYVAEARRKLGIVQP